MTSKPDFYPPLLTPALVKTLQWVAPWLSRWFYRLELVIDPASLELLRQVKHHRLLLLSNHPTFDDIITIFLLSARLKEPFHYWAAYERFQGLAGWWLRRLGAYSLRRGLGDRPSVAHTLSLLTQPQCRLVVFPEGGCTFQNDEVSPFRPGAIQIALQSMSRLERRQEEADLLLVPISIKYRYLRNMEPVIAQTLARLEAELNLTAQGQPYDRLRAIAERVLTLFEDEYGVPSRNDFSWNERIARLKTHVVERCESTLGLVPAAQTPIRERVYKIQAVLEEQSDQDFSQHGWTSSAMYRATTRLLNFDAIYDGYVANRPTSERFLDTLIRLERAIFAIDQPPPKGDRQVWVKIGPLTPIKPYLSHYHTDKTGTVAQLVEAMQTTIQQNLDQLSKGA